MSGTDKYYDAEHTTKFIDNIAEAVSKYMEARAKARSGPNEVLISILMVLNQYQVSCIEGYIDTFASGADAATREQVRDSIALLIVALSVKAALQIAPDEETLMRVFNLLREDTHGTKGIDERAAKFVKDILEQAAIDLKRS